jgi:ATP-dependent RNA helicase DeaD
LKAFLNIALEKRGYDVLTPVQQEVSKSELETSDLLVSAQTGSGKTVGFGIAIAPNLLTDKEVFERASNPLGLVIAPTRELAMQVKRELQWLYAETGVVMASCVGGMDMRDERRALERGAHIVVATPGRLRDHIMRRTIDLSQICAVVLDEADEMLDLGFAEDLKMILDTTPETRRTLMFSATVPKGIANLAKQYQRSAIRIKTLAEKTQHTDIEYQAIKVGKHDGENAIINVLRFHEAPSALVFANTRATVGRLTTRLSNRGFSVVCLSGELSQAERSHALQAMRDGRARICVATDVAARGIDLPKLDLVIHAELPSNHERLLHRSGRTGRAGRKGTSVLIVPPNALRKAERVLKTAKLTALWGVAPTADEVLVKDHERILKDDVWTRNVNSVHEHMVPKLLELYGAERVAAAFLETYTEKLSAPEDVVEFQEDPKRKPKKSHEDFGEGVWLRMGKGQRDGLSPGQVVPMICKSGDITNKDIGAIRIQSDHTFIELRKLCVKGFFKSIGPDESVEGAKIIQLTEVPNIPPQAKGRNNERPKRRLPDGEPKRKSSFKSTIDKEKKARPERNKPERQGKSTGGQDKKSHQKHAKNVQEGDGLKFKKKDGKSKGAGTPKPIKKENSKLRKGASDPSIPMRAPKVGKHNSKKNKARRAQALLKTQGKESPASRRR